MINSLGLLEVFGMASSIDAADAMLKSANVRIINHEVVIPGMVTIVVEGDLAACRAAVDAGVAAANRTGRVIGSKVIGRPDDDTEWLITGFSGVKIKKPTPSKPEVTPSGSLKPTDTRESSPVSDSKQATPEMAVTPPPAELPALNEAEMLSLVAKHHRVGITAGEAAIHFATDFEPCFDVLEALFKRGQLRKRGSRYRIKNEVKSGE